MTSERGIVERVEDSWAWVATRRKDACGKCSQKGFCQIVGGASRVLVKAKNAARAGVGDEVELCLNTRAKIKGLFVLYMFPVLGILMGAILAESLSDMLGLPRSMSMTLFVMTGLALAIILARAVANRMEARQEMCPTVCRVVRRAQRRVFADSHQRTSPSVHVP